MAKPFFFGAGNLYAIPISSGVVTPQKFGTVQEVTVEFSGSMKELHGEKQYAVALGRGKSKITLKAKSAELKGDLIAQYFGTTAATGEKRLAQDEAGIIPATPFAVTVSNGANFIQNLGVRSVAVDGTVTPFTRVSADPITGQYILDDATGIYTFAAADTGKAVLIDYIWSSAATGKTVSINNQNMGLAPSFQTILSGEHDGVATLLWLYKVISSKLGMATKSEDFMVPEFDMEAQSNDADQVGLLSVGG